MEEQHGPTLTAEQGLAKHLRIQVDGTDPKDGTPVHVNVRVPIRLVRFGLRFMNHMPAEARDSVNEELRKQGIDADIANLSPAEIDELVEALADTTIDVDRPQDQVKARISAE